MRVKEREDRSEPPQKAIAKEPTLEAMKGLWSAALGHSAFRMDESFFHAGGDPLKASRLQLLIEDRFAVHVEPNVFERATLRQSVELLDKPASEVALPAADANRPQIAPLSLGGSKSPVFFIHAISGSVDLYYRVVDSMKIDRPCYGIHAPAYAVADEGLTIERMASAYLEAVRDFLPPEGTAVFAGYSMGGAIAYEMARQHAQNGGPALPVVMMDCDAGAARSGVRMAADGLLNLPGWLIHVAAKTKPRALLLRAAFRCRKIFGPRKMSLNSRTWAAMAGNAALDSRAKQLMMVALTGYVGRAYAGPVVLLKARDNGLFTTRDPSLGWARHATNLQVDTLPGCHELCLFGENSEESAEVMRRHLDCFE